MNVSCQERTPPPVVRGIKENSVSLPSSGWGGDRHQEVENVVSSYRGKEKRKEECIGGCAATDCIIEDVYSSTKGRSGSVG